MGERAGEGGAPPRFCPPPPPPLAFVWGTRTGVRAQTQTRPPCLCAGATPERGVREREGPPASVCTQRWLRTRSGAGTPIPRLHVKGAFLSAPPRWPAPLLL